MTQSRLNLIDQAANGDRLALEALDAMKPQSLAKLNNDLYFVGVASEEAAGEQLGADRFE